MRFLSRVIPTTQTSKPTRKRSSHQTELPLPSKTAHNPLPEAVMVDCRPLIGQLLREVLLADKEAHDEY